MYTFMHTDTDTHVDVSAGGGVVEPEEASIAALVAHDIHAAHRVLPAARGQMPQVRPHLGPGGPAPALGPPVQPPLLALGLDPLTLVLARLDPHPDPGLLKLLGQGRLERAAEHHGCAVRGVDALSVSRGTTHAPHSNGVPDRQN